MTHGRRTRRKDASPLLRRVVAAAAVVVVALGVGLYVAWLKLPALMAPRLEAALVQATGHAARIGGGVGLGWDGGLEVRLRDVAVANATWGTRPDMLIAPLVAARLDLSGLTSATVRIDRIRLERPDLLLERDAAGHGNWERPPIAARPATPSDAAASTSGGPTVELGKISMVGGHVAFRDAKSGRVYQTGVDGTADAAAEPARVSLTLHAPAAELLLEGTIDRAAPLRRSSLALSGTVMLPEKFDVAAKLEPGQAGQTITGQARGAGIQASLAGVIDPDAMRPVGAVTVDAALSDGAKLPERFAVAGLRGPASLHVLLRQQDAGVTLRDLRLVLPAGDLAGELDIGVATPPSVRGSLTSRHLDVAKAVASAEAPPPPPPAVAPAATPASAPAVPPRLPMQWLNDANADLHLAAAELQDGRVTLRDLAGHLVIQDGRLILDPFVGSGPGGPLHLTLRADARASPPSVALLLKAPALALQPFVVLAGLPGDITGAAAIDADLHANGATQPELLRSLGGKVAVSMGDGDIDLRLLGGILSAARLPIDPRGRAHLRCLVMRADLAHGVANVAPVVVDATNFLLQGTGTVDLVQETLALRLRPLLRTGPGLTIPLTLSGPWTKPKVDLDRGDLAGVLAGMIGPAGDPCHAAGITSAAPPPATKPLKPVDLLKSLLR